MKQVSKCLVILTLVLFSCSTEKPSVVIEQLNSPTPTIETTVVRQPTSTPNALDEKSKIYDRCISINAQTIQSDMKIGAVEFGTSPLLIDTQTQQREYLGGEVYETISISPDKTHLAYLNLTNHSINILDHRGNVLQTYSVETDWRRVLSWLSNEKLLIENFRTKATGLYTLSSVIVFDINTGNYEELLPEYPNIMSPMDNSVHWGKYSTTYAVYNNDLTNVVYPAVIDNESPIILWDIQAFREIGRIHSGGYYFSSLPAWNPDGTSFVISAFPAFKNAKGDLIKNGLDDLPYIGGTELFSMNQDGLVKRLTYWTTKQIASAENFSWSPDGKFIAFWLAIRKGIPQLAILDVTSGKVNNLCLQGGDDKTGSSAAPIWSPDGTQLLVTIPNPKKKYHSEIALVDLEQDTAVLIANDVEAMGWIVNAP